MKVRCGRLRPDRSVRRCSRKINKLSLRRTNELLVAQLLTAHEYGWRALMARFQHFAYSLIIVGSAIKTHRCLVSESEIHRTIAIALLILKRNSVEF